LRGCGGLAFLTMLVPEGLALADVAWLTDRLPTHGHLIPNGLQEPDDSVLGASDIRPRVHRGRRASGRTVVRAIHDCWLPCPA